MRQAEILCALGLLVVAGLTLWQSAAHLYIWWGPSGPGSGFFPFWLSVGLGLCALGILAKALRMRPDAAPAKTRFIPEGALPSLLKVVGPIVGMILVMQVVGFYLAAAIYLAVVTRWLGRHSWPVVLGVSLLFPVAVYLVIEQWFLVVLPRGYIDFRMPF